MFCFEMFWAHIVKRYNLQLNFDGVYFFQNHTYVADELCMYCIVGNGRSTTGVLTNEWPSCRIQCDQSGNDNHICICWDDEKTDSWLSLFLQNPFTMKNLPNLKISQQMYSINEFLFLIHSIYNVAHFCCHKSHQLLIFLLSCNIKPDIVILSNVCIYTFCWSLLQCL